MKGDMSKCDVTVLTKHGPTLTKCVDTSVPDVVRNMDKCEVPAAFPYGQQTNVWPL
jgi:hypothetical protein